MLLVSSTVSVTLTVCSPTCEAEHDAPKGVYSTSSRDGTPIYCWDDERDGDRDSDPEKERDKNDARHLPPHHAPKPLSGTVERSRYDVKFIPWDEHIRNAEMELKKTLKQGKNPSVLRTILYSLQQRKALEDRECDRSRMTPTPVATTPLDPSPTTLPSTTTPEPTSTPTVTATLTPSPSQTAIPTTPTQAPTEPPTDTPTFTIVPATATFTAAPTETSTPPAATPTPPPTAQPTIADTSTPTSTATNTDTVTATATFTPPSATDTPTGTSTSTPAPTETATATNTDTVTPTATFTPPSATDTPTSTSTSTPAPTETATATSTPTVTPTRTPTPSPTATAVPATATPTSTPSSTATVAPSSWNGNVTTAAFAVAIEIPSPFLGNRATGSTLWGSLPNTALSCKTCHGTTPGSAGPVKTIKDAQPYSYLNNANWAGMGISKPAIQQLSDLTAYLNRNTP